MAKGIFWICFGLAIVVYDLFNPLFLIDLGLFKFDLGVLAIIYGVLLLVAHRITLNKMALSDAEVAEYGQTLEKVTPEILEMFKKRYKVKQIARTLHHSEGLPEHVTLRYIIALLKQMQQNQAPDPK